MAFPGVFICAGCKPIAVSKLARGEALGVIWRKGKCLVILRGQPLPDRCIHCNEPAYGYRLKRTYSWYHPALPLLIVLPLGGLSIVHFPSDIVPISAAFVFILVALVVRKYADIDIPICPHHRKWRARHAVIASALLVSSIGLVAAAVVARNWYLVPAAIVALMVGLIWISIGLRLLRLARVTEGHLFINGTGHAFRAEFPEWPGK